MERTKQIRHPEESEETEEISRAYAQFIWLYTKRIHNIVVHVFTSSVFFSMYVPCYFSIPYDCLVLLVGKSPQRCASVRPP